MPQHGRCLEATFNINIHLGWPLEPFEKDSEFCGPYEANKGKYLNIPKANPAIAVQARIHACGRKTNPSLAPV